MRIIVEGESDTQAALKIARFCGHEDIRIRPAGGKSKLDPKITNYARAARYEPWVVFRDSDGDCPVELRNRLMHGAPSTTNFALRIACSMTEAWLMADRENFAKFFGLSVDVVTHDPDAVPHAKRELLRLCAKSRRRDIREEVVGPNQKAGPLYVGWLNEFAANHWDVANAEGNSESLRRAVAALRTLR